MNYKVGDMLYDKFTGERLGTITEYKNTGDGFFRTNGGDMWRTAGALLSRGWVNYNPLNIHERPTDVVESPSHYNAGSIETIDYLRETMSTEEYRGFCKGNVLKYVSREGYKNGLEDLKKAQKYLEWLIESHEKTPED